jgi:DNA-binding CsgD family transcriptional regulator
LVNGLTMLAALGAESAGIFGLDSGIGITVSEAVERAQEAAAIAREIGWRAGEAYALIELSMCTGVLGDGATAMSAARDALAILAEIDHRQLAAAGEGAIGLAYGGLLAFSAADRHLQAARSLAIEVGSAYLDKHLTVFHAWIICQEGDVERAATVLDGAFGIDTTSHPMLDRLAWLVRAEIALARGAADLALSISDRLADGRPEGHSPALGLLRGRALTALNRATEAVAELRVAKAAAQRQQARTLLWRISLASGFALQQCGQPREASAEWDAARSLIDDLTAALPEKADPDLSGASPRDSFARQANALVPPARRATQLRQAKLAHDGLTARERQIAAMIGRGHSNRSIAEALVVSERTVETHVTNILAKLNAVSRTQIAAWAIGKGLAEPTPQRSVPAASAT